MNSLAQLRNRCDSELARCEQLLREGHPEVEGLTMALKDWSMEKRMIDRDEYRNFLDSKRTVAESTGFQIPESDISASGFPFQRDIARWAIRKGRCAVWADCGLGKTWIQLGVRCQQIVSDSQSIHHHSKGFTFTPIRSETWEIVRIRTASRNAFHFWSENSTE